MQLAKTFLLKGLVNPNHKKNIFFHFTFVLSHTDNFISIHVAMFKALRNDNVRLSQRSKVNCTVTS